MSEIIIIQEEPTVCKALVETQQVYIYYTTLASQLLISTVGNHFDNIKYSAIVVIVVGGMHATLLHGGYMPTLA